MPRIPQVFEQEVRPVNQALSRTDTTPGLAQAQALQVLGKGLADLGTGVAAYQARKSAIDDNLSKNQSLNAARKSAIDAADFAMNRKDRAPDGSDILDTFESENESRKKQYLAALPEDKRDQAAIIWDDQALDRREKLIEQERTLHAQYTIRASEEIKNEFSLDAYNSPNQFNDTASRMIEHYDTLQVAGLVTEDQAMKMKTVASKELAMSAINGMVERDRDYKAAVERITIGDMAPLFDQKERLEMVRYVEERKVRQLNLDLQQESLRKNQMENRQKEQKEISFINSYDTMTRVGDSPEAFEAWRKGMEAKVASGMMDPKDAEWLIEKQQGRKGDMDERKEYQYRSLLMDGKDPGQVYDLLKTDQVIGAKTAIEILNEIKSWKEKSATDPNFSEKHQAAIRQIKTILFPESFSDKFDFTGALGQAKSRLLFDAQKTYFALLAQGNDPLVASEKVVQSFGSPMSRVPLVQGYAPAGQTNEKGLDAIERDIHQKVRSGRMAKDVAARNIQLLRARKKAIQIEQQQRKQPGGVNLPQAGGQ